MMKIHIYITYVNTDFCVVNICNDKWGVFCEMVLKGLRLWESWGNIC